MPVVSISEAARLSGRSRASLYRMFKSGELSKSETPKGEAGVEVSELLRVFQTLQGTVDESNEGDGKNAVAAPVVAVLEERIRGLEAALAANNQLLAANEQLIGELRQRIEDKDELAEELRGQVRLLLLPPERPAPAASPEAPRRGILARIFGGGG